MIVAVILLLSTISAPSPVIHTGAAQHTKIDQVTRVRITRAELPRTAWNYPLRVSSPFGTLNDRWRICSKQNGRCYVGYQVDVSAAKDIPYQQRTKAGIEIPPQWYKPLGCSTKEPPKRCRVMITKIK